MSRRGSDPTSDEVLTDVLQKNVELRAEIEKLRAVATEVRDWYYGDFENATRMDDAMIALSDALPEAIAAVPEAKEEP